MKDPKEYAKELVEKYYQVQEKPEWGNEELKKEAEITYANNFVEFEKYYRGLAVECALIAVDELINQVTHSDVGYWDAVKEEILKNK